MSGKLTRRPVLDIMPNMLLRRLSAITLAALTIGVARADSVRTLDGKVIEGLVKLDPKGGLSISPRNGQNLVHVDFAQVLRVKLDGNDQPADAGSPNPWFGSDIGGAGLGGSQKLAGNQLTVEGSGQDITGSADSFRFVSQAIAGNGEVSAHLIPGGQTQPNMMAGVMLRSSIDANSAMVALVLKHDGGLRLLARLHAGEALQVVKSSDEHLPLWLRLVRKETNVTALKSTDGKNWINIADINYDPGANMLGGVAVCSRDPAALCSAVFENARAIAEEPVGANIVPITDLKPSILKLKKTDKHSQINTVMLNGQVIQRDLVEGTSCEIRYTLDGKYNMLVGSTYMPDREKSGGSVTFEIDADNDKIFDSGKVTGDMPSMPLNLVITGKKELRFLVTDSGNGKTFDSAEFHNIRLVTLSNVRQAVKSQTSTIVTTGGSIYSGIEIRMATKDTVQFSRADRRDLSVPADQVSRIYLPGITADLIAKLPATSTGVMMANGDFYEGDIDRFENGKVQVNSVIFGPREFTLRQDVLAVVLRPAASDAKPSDYIVEAGDGTTLMADALATDDGKLNVTDHTLGHLSIDLRAVREISYAGDKLKWLADLRPRRVDPAPNRSADGFLIDATIFGPSLQLVGLDCDRGVSLTGGSSVSYDLDGQYKTLVCVAGVPAEVLPNVAAVFVAESEGKEIFRSQPRTSVQDGLPVSIDTSKVKTITLRVETDKGAMLPVVGLWGDPLLVKAAP